MITIFSLSARFGAFLLSASQIAAVPAFADHPGENLNQVMAAKEASFEPITPRDAPELVWQGASGDLVSLSTLKGKVVVLSFLPNGCGSPCEAQQETWPNDLRAQFQCDARNGGLCHAER